MAEGNASGIDSKIWCDYCVEAREMSHECVKHHDSNVEEVKSRGVQEIGEKSSEIFLTRDSEPVVGTPLCTEHKQLLECFCIKHMTELCISCKVIEHEHCKETVPIRKAAAEGFSESHSAKILKSVKDLLERFKQYQTLLERNTVKVTQQKQDALDNLKQTKKNIASYLDKLEATVSGEIEKVFCEEMKSVTEKLHACEASVTFLNERIYHLERVMSVGEKEAVFISVNDLTKETKKYCKWLHELNQEIFDTELIFEQSETVASLADIFPMLGKVSVTKSSVFVASAGATAIYTDEIKLKTETDTCNPFITSYKELYGGRKLLVDITNKKLKLYDPHNRLLTELVLPDNPWNVVSLSDTELVVSFLLTQSLQYISIGNELIPTDVIHTSYQIFAMVKYGDDILASIYDDIYKIAIINKGGTIKKIIMTDNGSVFNNPHFLALSADQKTVFIVDSSVGCIGIDVEMHSGKIWSLDAEVKSFIGLAVCDDCLFIGVDKGEHSGRHSEVRRISFTGEVKALEIGNSHPLKSTGQELVIYNKDDTKNPLINFYFLL